MFNKNNNNNKNNARCKFPVVRRAKQRRNRVEVENPRIGRVLPSFLAPNHPLAFADFAAAHVVSLKPLFVDQEPFSSAFEPLTPRNRSAFLSQKS